MKKLDNGNLYTRDEFRERVENGCLQILTVKDSILMRMEIGQVNGCLLLLSHWMKMKTKIWNIHM